MQFSPANEDYTTTNITATMHDYSLLFSIGYRMANVSDKLQFSNIYARILLAGIESYQIQAEGKVIV